VNKNSMFCYQCEQTTEGKACTTFGVCGKNPEVAALQDLLMYTLMELSQVATTARKLEIKDEEIDIFTCKALFSTLTNVNFNPNNFEKLIKKTVKLCNSLRKKVENAGGLVKLTKHIPFIPKNSINDLVEQGKLEGFKANTSLDEDTRSLQNILIYGIKGVASYTYHACRLDQKDDNVFEFVHRGLSAVLDKSLSRNDLLGLVLECGKINIRAMELLDAGNTETYGHPAPTQVPLGHKKGKAILVSGHDLKDLEGVLKQSEDKGIYVYTHGEMLPAHAYPNLKEYSHFYGHYGTAWQNQQKEFRNFPGAILMTTNCLQKPTNKYKENLFTSGPVGWPSVTHIECSNIACGDFSPIIEKAIEMPGFRQDKKDKTITVGFGRNSFLSLVEKITELVMKGQVNSFFLVAGCDGAKPGRNYYTEFVEKTPNDSLVLTLACGKFRFFDKNIGQIDGIPRLLDIGQCNDAYSAIKIAQAFEKIFESGINELPLFFILSWYEQKAVSILLSLFYLGVKNIRLGPSLPAFMTSKLLKKFNVMPLKTPDEDLKAIIDYVNGVGT
jgi:hydroxylamine reductase